MNVIEITGLTKGYGQERGIFDLNLTVAAGQVLGFLGPNGAGKTTTIRHLMGFLRPDCGSAKILGRDCFTQREQIQPQLGYLPGEVALLEDMNGDAYLNLVARLKGIAPQAKRIKELIELFELDPSVKIRKMSKGTKQKIGIVAAFMGQAQILLLDEPTSGLDPLMQGRFIDLIQGEKSAGRTILLSSHLFEEVEKTCDAVTFIRGGKIVATRSMTEVKHQRQRHYLVTVAQEDAAALGAALRAVPGVTIAPDLHAKQLNNTVELTATVQGEVTAFLRTISQFSVFDLQVNMPSLEEMFLSYYQQEQK